MLELVIGDKQLSSWSLRAWLLLRHAGLAFRELPLPLDTPAFHAAIGRYTPAARVPVLIDGPLHVWDTLSIAEYVNERCNGRLWPGAAAERAHARSISAEMHSGFAALRNQWPLQSATTGLEVPLDAHSGRDLERIETIWSECRARHAARGPWLFGAFSIADAMYAPVTLRVRTYGAILTEPARDYASHVVRDPHVAAWIAGAAAELARSPV
jgi:glutathione S-transferase